MARPRIGITCDYELVLDKRGAPAPRFITPAAYVSAVDRAGGLPLLLPHLPPAAAPEVCAALDGLLVSGGDFDVPPHYYGQSPRPKLGRVLEERSAFERALLQRALELDLPLLGVCGGMQLLNVVLGGTLHQDISERPGSGVHQQEHDKRKPSHPVRVQPGTELARIVGSEALEVNSTHHQVVDALGRELVAAAHAPDGVVEAIEVSARTFALGVQWHPEALESARHAAIYLALIVAAERHTASGRS